MLIDGLDEISDEGSRTAFAANLRSFLAMFPQVAMIATSREAGYRHVASVIASSCPQVSIAAFDKSDVKQLCERWHVEVVGDKQSVRDDAIKLASTIWDNARVRALAENPLMLTTLLVIRRCIGELPTRRVELYRQSIEVLIRTWNTEGYEAMNLDEALTQLSYVACAMMQAGIQQVGHRQLVTWLKQARTELDVELGYTKLSPQEFIKRIEYRSSLLMQTGLEYIDDELQPVYEFRHLTFQEYLTARGFIEQQYPGWQEDKTLLELLEPHLNDEGWKEVIPLAAVLAKRKAEPLITKLTEALRKQKYDTHLALTVSLNLLHQCLLDEVKISSKHLKQALQQFARHSDGFGQSMEMLLQSKFGDLATEVIESSFFDINEKWSEYCDSFENVSCKNYFAESLTTSELYQEIISGLTSSRHIDQCKASLISMSAAHRNKQDFDSKQFKNLQTFISDLLFSSAPQVVLTSAWALAWFGEHRVCTYLPSFESLVRLLNLASNQTSTELARFAGWAFVTQPLLARDAFTANDKEQCLKQVIHLDGKSEFLPEIKIILSWYRCYDVSDIELFTQIEIQSYIDSKAVKDIKALLEKSMS